MAIWPCNISSVIYVPYSFVRQSEVLVYWDSMSESWKRGQRHGQVPWPITRKSLHLYLHNPASAPDRAACSYDDAGRSLSQGSQQSHTLVHPQSQLAEVGVAHGSEWC